MLNGMKTSAFVTAGLLAGAVFAGSAFAGGCPADKLMTNAREPVKEEALGVTDTVLAMLPLANEAPMLLDRKMRVRKLTIEVGGIVPWHSHGDRPALIYIVEGEIHEYASNCAAPIVHGPGDVAVESHEVSHWWKNLGNRPVTLLSFDIMHDESDHSM
jgi:quercetin dioxygenase-like cupin family protein